MNDTNRFKNRANNKKHNVLYKISGAVHAAEGEAESTVRNETMKIQIYNMFIMNSTERKCINTHTMHISKLFPHISICRRGFCLWADPHFS